MIKIAFTGGGSIGHVAVNVALIPYFQQKGYETFYIGSRDGIEKEMIESLEAVNYYPISSGKLRRYFDWKNFTDPFKVLKGIIDAFTILKKEQPHLIFSKGGFVSVPVVIAAKILKIPVVLHESDVTPGLANKISLKFADHLFTTFEEAGQGFPQDKVTVIGSIIRDSLYHGQADKAYDITGFDQSKPILLIMGGSLGSQTINKTIREALPHLLDQFQIIHLTGKGLLDDTLTQTGYVQFEFITDELSDLLSITDYVISRAGSNSIFEFLALKKPMLLIPLTSAASRGDQELNARYFQEKGYAEVLDEENLSTSTLVDSLNQLVKESSNMIQNMENYPVAYQIEDVYQALTQFIK